MNEKIINLSLWLVMIKLEDILANYPVTPYQKAFDNLELRRRIILKVLNQIPSYYTILKEEQELPKDPDFLDSAFSLEEKQCIESLIHDNIELLIYFHLKPSSKRSIG